MINEEASGDSDNLIEGLDDDLNNEDEMLNDSGDDDGSLNSGDDDSHF
jgi:hypothetical protein